MSFHNTKYIVGNILDSLGGLPEECSWIDFKAGYEFKEKKPLKKIMPLVAGFINSIQAFDKDKYIIYGVLEDKKKKKKRL